MAEFQKSKNPKGSVYSKATILVLFFVSIVLIIGLFSIVPKERETRKNKDLVLNALGSMRDQSTSLASEIESLKTEDGIEEKIREKYRVVKEGEGLIVIVDEKNDNEDIPASESTGFLNFLKNIFN